ncbi:MAG: 23S rRNA (adenine1618-N6)-methyltransferase [Oceanospirillaceae bacterium]|jgi:23S rRNA (adenine1618-N6)-methyltransferase
MSDSSNSSKPKPTLHPRNKHQGRYDLKKLSASNKDLGRFVSPNKYGDESINFFDPKAVKALNKALLKEYYEIDHWDIPNTFLCPPIPGRADYIHHVADLLAKENNGKVPLGRKTKCLDIGVGANCVYPIVGVKEYGWSFVGSDVDETAIENAKKIVEENPTLTDRVKIRLQGNPKNIFIGVIQETEEIDITICNPPFHASAAEAQANAQQKMNNLNRDKEVKPTSNFGGTNRELWYKGGEIAFIRRMIQQSREISRCVGWFTTLVSKESNLRPINKALQKVGAVDITVIPMGQGHKKSRIVAWRF